MNPLTPSKIATILTVLIALTLVCFPLSPQAQAVCQDACLTNDNTVQGDDALINLTTGSENTANGSGALHENTQGGENTAVGFQALFSNTTGFGNTANGIRALLNNTIGHSNTATGAEALASNTLGSSNTANGSSALHENTTGMGNTATGVFALVLNTTGNSNTASGAFALSSNKRGSNNTANGFGALEFMETGHSNTATGAFALRINTTGKSNTASGFTALMNNTTGESNTASGASALHDNTTGSENTATGFQALFSNTTGNKNIGLGFRAGSDLTTGDNNIDIGNAGVAGEAGTIRIGTVGTQTETFIAGISGAAIGGMEVRVNQNGRLGIQPSSKRFKDEIKPMDGASEAILALKPVTFRYKKEMDADHVPQFGLVAEDVEKVNPDLVVRDADGKPYTVRYDAVNAMLLNEFLKEHRKVEHMQKQIEALAAGLQKVSAQLEATRSAPQTVLNNY